MTPASKIVRALITLDGTGKKVFNDRVSFGRSIKVWGWSDDQYAKAKQYLEAAGYSVKIVRSRPLKWSWCKGNALRLHVIG